ncbi:MAG: hypothetical protein ACLP9L_03735 [Thermoguttaceae bacterium]
MVMWMREESLKPGKSSALVKRDLRALPLTEAEFEADFPLDRKFSSKRREIWKGLVVERESVPDPNSRGTRNPVGMTSSYSSPSRRLLP